MPHSSAARVRVVGLRVDYVARPLGLHNARPRFSWRLESNARNVRQSAYRILVATERAGLAAAAADLWDSGKIAAPTSLSVPYEGPTLRSRQRCWWTVQAWDELDQRCAPPEPASWEMGLLSPEDWSAQWIAADDPTAAADRATALQWMWGADAANHEPTVRRFRAEFELPRATGGGTLFVLGKSRFEKIAGLWLDDSSAGCDAIGEHVQLGSLMPGRHRLEVKVRRQNPWPEYYGELPMAGIALFARFDTGDGVAFRVSSGAEWKTCLDAPGQAWDAVCTSTLQGHPLREPAMHVRRAFAVDKDVVSARLYATALGCYEARLNGQRIGDALLTPEVSQYDERLQYQVHDVRALLRRGANVIGFTVGDGWYAGHPGRYSWGAPPRRLIAQLEITYADGTREAIVTGPDWRVSRSPIVQSELCTGELYDARLEQLDWDTAGFDDAGWVPAGLAAKPPCRLAAQVGPPIRATEILRAAAITNPMPGVYVLDFGQNFAGWCRLHVRGARGTRVDLRYGEQIAPGGEIDQFSLNGGKATDTYVLRGDPAGETFEPHFTYHGFRYVQVTGLPAVPTVDSIQGVVLHTDLEPTGRLRVDHPLIDKLWRSIVWTQRSNFMAVGTDCCNRAERMGYFLDMGVFWDAATFNMDVAAFTRRQLDNARDRQCEAGALPSLAPAPDVYVIYRFADGTATPGWGDGVIVLAWTCWRRYGDLGILQQNWEAMNRHLTFILDRNPNYLWLNGRGPDLGDWLAVDEQHFMRPEVPPTTPLDVFATAHWARSAQLLSEIADALSRPEDGNRLRVVHDNVRKAFIEAFVSPEGRVGNGSQTSSLLALAFGLVPDALRKRVMEHLVADIQERGCALSTGLFGTQHILDVLAEGGFADLACTLLLRREHPSWGYMLEHGATTIWERWDGSLDRRYLTASHNHPALGSVGAFLFRRLAGIEEAAPGFRRIRVRPLRDERLQRGGGDYDSVMGRISTTWSQLPDGGFTLEARIPANCAATIHLPALAGSCIREGSESIERRADVRVLSRSSREVVVAVGSGQYCFSVEPSGSIG